jgi:hypothetical protein
VYCGRVVAVVVVVDELDDFPDEQATSNAAAMSTVSRFIVPFPSR